MRPLLVYVADKNMAEAVGGLLERDQIHRIVGCAPFEFDGRQDIKVAAGQNDPGLYVRANELLRPFADDYAHAVVIADEEWDGSPGHEAIRVALAGHLFDAGWPADRALPLVACPEADIWLWSDSPHSAQVLGWESWDVLREALVGNGWAMRSERKPERPKEAAEWALRNSRRRLPRSAALYRKVASKVSVNRCEDPALHGLLDALRAWFPQVQP